MQTMPWLDSLAFLVFLANVLGYAWLVDWGPFRVHTLSTSMSHARRAWINQFAKRDVRIMDMQIVLGLQNGTAFFASSSLLALGATFSLLTAGPDVQRVASEFGLPVTTDAWGSKILLLMICFGYSVFKFAWAYRLFNYASITMGAIPERDQIDTKQGVAAIERSVRMHILSAAQFTRGLRGIFYAASVLFWFAGPLWFALATFSVTLVLAYRQFMSPPHHVMSIVE